MLRHHRLAGARTLLLVYALAWLAVSGYGLALILAVHEVTRSYATAGATVAGTATVRRRALRDPSALSARRARVLCGRAVLTAYDAPVHIRGAEIDDHARVLAVADAWWGRAVGERLAQRLFFEHFADTSLIAEDERELVGFLVGLLSQARPEEAYIHMVGVHPDHRGAGLARELYDRFFELARQHRRGVVSCITSPVNRGSIAFHAALGFTVSPSPDHEGAGHDRVVFRRGL